jgi:hypothetical protein
VSEGTLLAVSYPLVVGRHRQCRHNDATEPSRAEMTTPPKMDTNCTTLSLIPTVNGNTVRSFYYPLG